MAERYKLKFDNLYTVTDDGYLEVPLDPNKVLLKSTEDEVTGGYYDGAGEWHEFGGGTYPVFPFFEVYIVNNYTGQPSISTSKMAKVVEAYRNDEMFWYVTYNSKTIGQGNSDYVEFSFIYDEINDEYYINVEDFLPRYIYTISGNVNCTVSGDKVVATGDALTGDDYAQFTVTVTGRD